MLLLSVYLVPLPPGHEGAKAISSVARMNVAFIDACAALPAADVIEGFTVRVSLRLPMLPVAVSSTEETLLEAMVAVSTIESATASGDVSFDAIISDSLFSGQTTFGSQAFFEQHPLNPVDAQE
jgi:hypothetical protein